MATSTKEGTGPARSTIAPFDSARQRIRLRVVSHRRYFRLPPMFGAWAVTASVTDHFDGTRFSNPTGANGQGFSKLWALLRTKRAPWPRSVPVTVQLPPRPGPGEVAVTF